MMQFDNPVNDEAMKKILEKFGEPAAVSSDRRTLLFDRMGTIRRSDMSEIAKAAKQTAEIEIVGEGTIKTMSDGTRYEVTKSGWRKLE